MEPLSRHALINGERLIFRFFVPHAFEANRVVVCEAQDGDQRYLLEDEWFVGARAFLKKAEDEGIVASESPASAKLALFRSLFKGRDDVHAHGYRRKDGGIGYAPACENEWKPNVCPKGSGRKVGCSDCPQRSFAPLSDRLLVEHFKGESASYRDVIGLYVLDSECKTSVLVADFGKDGWKDAVRAYQEAGRGFDIDVLIERSRSGNGGHAWIFFEEPVPANLAKVVDCRTLRGRLSSRGLRA